MNDERGSVILVAYVRVAIPWRKFLAFNGNSLKRLQENIEDNRGTSPGTEEARIMHIGRTPVKAHGDDSPRRRSNSAATYEIWGAP